MQLELTKEDIINVSAALSMLYKYEYERKTFSDEELQYNMDKLKLIDQTIQKVNKSVMA